MNATDPKTSASTEDLNEKIAALQADIARLASSLSGDVSDGIERAGRQISKTGRDARATATNTVLDHPLASVGIAVGVGVLLGLLARKG